PYRFIRHPAYAGSLLNVLGTVLALGSAAGVALVCVLTLPAYLYRIHVEERALLAGLTPDYARYRARTWRLVPFVVGAVTSGRRGSPRSRRSRSISCRPSP